MTDHLQPITSVEALDAESEGSVVGVLWHSRVCLVLLRTGNGWVAMDPSDRMDGEETLSSFSLFHHHAAPARGRSVIKLWEPGQTGHGAVTGAGGLDALPVESIVLFDEGQWWPKIWQRTGWEWLELDPTDRSDGETTLPSKLLPLMSPGTRILHVFSPATVV